MSNANGDLVPEVIGGVERAGNRAESKVFGASRDFVTEGGKDFG